MSEMLFRYSTHYPLNTLLALPHTATDTLTGLQRFVENLLTTLHIYIFNPESGKAALSIIFKHVPDQSQDTLHISHTFHYYLYFANELDQDQYT